MMNASTVWELLTAGSKDAPAIAAPSRPALTYQDLRQQTENTVFTLNKLASAVMTVWPLASQWP